MSDVWPSNRAKTAACGHNSKKSLEIAFFSAKLESVIHSALAMALGGMLGKRP
jgi:hypothetical protein